MKPSDYDGRKPEPPYETEAQGSELSGGLGGKLTGDSTACPKCGLEFKTLLHPFCTHKDCPVRAYRDKVCQEPAVDPPNKCMECGVEIPYDQTWCGHCQNFDELGPND